MIRQRAAQRTQKVTVADIDQRQAAIQQQLETLRQREHDIDEALTADFGSAKLQAEARDVRAKIEAAQRSLVALEPLRRDAQVSELLAQMTDFQNKHSQAVIEATAATQRRDEIRAQLQAADQEADQAWNLARSHSDSISQIKNALRRLGVSAEELAELR